MLGNAPVTSAMALITVRSVLEEKICENSRQRREGGGRRIFEETGNGVSSRGGAEE